MKPLTNCKEEPAENQPAPREAPNIPARFGCRGCQDESLPFMEPVRTLPKFPCLLRSRSQGPSEPCAPHRGSRPLTAAPVPSQGFPSPHITACSGRAPLPGPERALRPSQGLPSPHRGSRPRTSRLLSGRAPLPAGFVQRPCPAVPLSRQGAPRPRRRPHLLLPPAARAVS